METDELSTGDIATAFLQGYDFDETMEQQYVGLRAYPGAEVDVREYWEVLAQNGVRHGCVGRDALMAPPKSRAWQSGPQR